MIKCSYFSIIFFFVILFFSVTVNGLSVEDELLVWLDASTLDLKEGDQVTEWKDLSGNNLHAFQENPEYKPVYRKGKFNDHPVISFNEEFLKIDFEKYYQPPFTVFVVFSINKYNFHMQIIDGLDPGNRLRLGMERIENNLYKLFCTTDWPPVMEKELYLSREEKYQVSILYNYDNKESILRLNNGELSRNAGLGELPVSKITIGARTTHDSQWFKGNIAETIIFNRDLNKEEIMMVEEYLQNKYKYETKKIVEKELTEAPTNTDYDTRNQWMLELFKDKRIESNTKKGLIEVLAKLRLTDGQNEEAMEYIANNIPGHANMFDIPPVVQALYMYGESFSKEQIEKIRKAVTGSEVGRIITGGGTENHAAMSVVGMYLLPQYFPDEKWDTERMGILNSEEMKVIAKERILQRSRGYYHFSNNEQLSTTYFTTNLYPFFILMKFAEDQVVRDAAEALVLYHLSMVALNNFDGHLMPPFNRRNVLQQQYGPPLRKEGRSLPTFLPFTWLFWEQNEVIAEDFISALEPAYPLFYGVTDWQMPELLNRIALGAEVPYEIWGTLGHFNQWGKNEEQDVLRYVWRDKKYAIGGPVAQYFDPDEFYIDHHSFNITWKSNNRFRALETMHPYWHSNRGEDYWKNTHSPFQQFGIHQNTAIVMYDIPDSDPWIFRGRNDWRELRNQHFDNLIHLAQIRFPTTIDKLVQNGDWYFFREKDVFVAIRVLKPGHTLNQLPDERLRELDGYSDLFNVIKSHESQTGFIFEVGKADDYDFNSFQKTVKNNALKINWDEMEVQYTNSQGDQLRFKYDNDFRENKNGFILISPDLWVNNKLRKDKITVWPITESPLVSLNNGILNVEKNGDGFTVDWSGKYPRIEK